MAVLNLGLLPVTGADSISITSGVIRLVNDEASPGNEQYYGTDGTGAKGWFSLSAEGVSTVAGTTGQVLVNGDVAPVGGAVTLSLPTALVSINSITSVAGQPLVLATGTSGTALSIASATNAVTLSSTTVSTSTITGSLISAGGVGIAGALYNGGGIVITGTNTLKFGATAAATLAVSADTTAGHLVITTPTTGNVGINTSSPSYKLEVNGSFGATTKSFVVPHQTKKGYRLQHGVTESGEHTVFVRGTLKGTSKIKLPSYWKWLVHEDSITVVLTPIGPNQDLYIASTPSFAGIKVGNNSKVKTAPKCYYRVEAERKDVPRLIAELPMVKPVTT